MANPIENADSLWDLAFHDGRYVSVGIAHGGAIWTSLGGLWTKNAQPGIFDAGADGGPTSSQKKETDVAILAVVNGPAGWLAGGSVACDYCVLPTAEANQRYAAWVSTDGLTWSRQQWQPGPASISDLASNGRSYVAADTEGLWFSAEGLAWQHVLTNDPDSARMLDPAARSGQYLAAAAR